MLVFVLFSPLLASPANALELFGICLTGNCDEAGNGVDLIDPKRYETEFSILPEPDALDAGAVRSKSELWLGRDKPVGGSAGLVTRAQGDYRRILAALYDQGFYGGTISIRVNGREASDIPPGAVMPETSNVVIGIDPGPLYRFGEAAVRNQAPPTDDPKDQVDPPSTSGFVPGEAARATSVRKAAALAREAWRQQGYAKADVADQNITADHPSNQLNAVVEMDPGRKAAYGDVTVQGTERMDPDFVREQTGLEHGREYDPDDLKRARKRLERLGVFSMQKIEEADTINPDGTLPLSVLLSEKPLRRIGAGVTFSSLDGAGVEGYWLHRNLFGRAERLKISGSVNGLGTTTDYQKLDYAVDATLTKPGFTHPDTDLVANIFAKREVEETYIENSAGGSVVMNHLYSDELTLTGGAFVKVAEFEKPVLGSSRFVTSGLIAGLEYDSRDSKPQPTRGLYINLEARPFYEWNFGNAGLRSEAEARTYLSADDKGKLVLAGRVKIGSLLGPPALQTPSDMLFLAGGGRSVRGYNFRSIGVPGPAGTILGGRSLVEGSLEARVRINESFGAVAFVDAGAVSNASFPDFALDPQIGAGAGIRYYTGLGPIRVDIAVPVNPRPGDPDFGIYAGIGQAF